MAAISGRIAFTSRSCLVPKILARIVSNAFMVSLLAVVSYQFSAVSFRLVAVGSTVMEVQQRRRVRCGRLGRAEGMLGLVTIHSEVPRGVAASAASGSTA